MNKLLNNQIAKITNLDSEFFTSLTFVKTNFLNLFEDQLVQTEDIDKCTHKLSKIIFKDADYHYKIYFSSDNCYLNDVLYLYNNQIIQQHTSEIIFIKNLNDEIIGYKHRTIYTNMGCINRSEYINFYTSLTESMKNNNLCCLDISPHNLGYIIDNFNAKIVKIIDIDLIVSADCLFNGYDKVPVSNINLRWHLEFGIVKFNSIMESLNLEKYYLQKFYQKDLPLQKMEKHLFVIWNDSIQFTKNILIELSELFQIAYVTKDNDLLIKDENNFDFLNEFYWNKYGDNETRRRFTSKCVIIIVNDLNSKYVNWYTSQRGKIPINLNTLYMKYYLRHKFGNSIPLCHASDDVHEFIHNLKIIKKFASINRISNLIDYEIKYSELYLKNEIKFLKKTILTDKNERFFNNYQKHLIDNFTDFDLFCIESSFIMSLNQIREAADLTYICEKNIQSALEGVRNHGNIIENHTNLTKNDIIFNPKNHFYYLGFKCMNLDILKKIKVNRNTEKDVRDVKLINCFIKHKDDFEKY